MKNKVFYYLFFVLIFLYIGLLAFNQDNLSNFLKPLIIPSLIAYTLINPKFKTRKLLLVALIFSWIGDVILIFAPIHQFYFVFGLVAFLISHLVYIKLFIKQNITTSNYRFLIIIPILITYLIGFLYILWNNLNQLKVPVTIYAIVIASMLFFATKGYFNWKGKEKVYILVGALFFIISDSILAINKFYVTLQYNSLLIMITYILAQFLIVYGICSINKKAPVTDAI